MLYEVITGDKLAFAPGERRIVDLEGHRDGRFVDRQRRHRFDRIGVAQRIRNLEFFDAGKGDVV